MEAIAALSLASNVLQVVDFTATTARWCKQIYDTGQTASNEDLDRNGQRLSESTARLSGAIANASNSHNVIAKDEQELLVQARDCTDLAKKMHEELAKLRLDGSKSRRVAFTRTVQARWKTKKIQSLEKKLSDRQVVLQTLLLTNTKYVLALNVFNVILPTQCESSFGLGKIELII